MPSFIDENKELWSAINHDDQLRITINMLDKKNNTLENYISELKNRISDLEDDMSDLAEEAESIKKDNDTLSDRCDYYREIINSFAEDDKDDRLTDIVEENRILKSRVNELNDIVSNLKMEKFCHDQIEKASEYIVKRYEKESVPTYNHITWDEYFMAVAQIVKSRSKDPNTKVGACIVKDNRIISTGYNGFPLGCDDKKYPWGKGDSDITKNKYFYVTHAELNAILNARQSVEGATVYVTLFPCNECAKAIIQSGIKKVIYGAVDLRTQEKTDKNNAIMAMFNDAGVNVSLYTPGNKKIEIEV